MAEEGLIDWYGHGKLVKWQAGAGDEFSASHAFERGKLCMMIDGEWRVAFVAAEHPGLQYRTAPMPVMGGGTYGSRYIGSMIIGIPERGKNREEAWKLVKYLTTNDHALATFSNGIQGIPSRRHRARKGEGRTRLQRCSADLHAPEVDHDPDHPARRCPPRHLPVLPREVAVGEGQRDLAGGLKKVDEQIDAKMKRAGERFSVISVCSQGSHGRPGRWPVSGRSDGRPGAGAAPSCSS